MNDKIQIGNLNIVFDWVERLKYMSFLCGVFATIFITGIFLVNQGIDLIPSLVLMGCGAIGVLITAIWTNDIRNKNFK